MTASPEPGPDHAGMGSAGMDADELELFATALGGVTANRTGEALDAALDELGWRDALELDRRAAISTLFDLQGQAGATSSALDHVLVAAAGLETSPSTAVVLPWPGSTAAGSAGVDGLAVRGLGTAALGRSETAVVAVDPDEIALVATKDLTLRPIAGIDEAFGLVEVHGAGVAADRQPGAWRDATDAGRVALAHQLVGTSRTMLALAREHAIERIQFDRPIAEFQAVRHRLAEAYVAVEGADSAAGGAWEDGSSLAAAAAKAMAGRSARIVARHSQQVLAGIGFTVEHPLHEFVRRALVLDRLLGDARSLTRELGADIIRSRHVPVLLPL
ncbi:MAG TPA: acyl-CoA dehydrogenase family protein [Microthrixaceae bacterium]|nr:acyl-CoA dehydrogenase family protein [Microthrixaceae bacterium]